MSKTIERNALVQFSCQKMFDLVNDIEAYPSFMKGCKNATIIDRGDNWLKAKLELSNNGFQQSFTTHNTLSSPHKMTISLVEGPFKIFNGVWRFKALSETACKVSFELQYEFSNFLLGLAGSALMARMASEQVDSLCLRAKTFYGDL